ncbi:MAG: hypothetical protein ACRELB_16105 [Polyangiaceae bacterium]
MEPASGCTAMMPSGGASLDVASIGAPESELGVKVDEPHAQSAAAQRVIAARVIGHLL